MIVYGIRLRPRHGKRSSHNNTVLPLLPVNMQFDIPCFSENMYGNNILTLILSESSSGSSWPMPYNVPDQNGHLPSLNYHTTGGLSPDRFNTHQLFYTAGL
ncbi:hypothetical protein TNCV_1132721 [Trichonephila clavipes]|nr:hypothetical protein TNCV_1132721 [Trichonephila clavipes]